MAAYETKKARDEQAKKEQQKKNEWDGLQQFIQTEIEQNQDANIGDLVKQYLSDNETADIAPGKIASLAKKYPKDRAALLAYNKAFITTGADFLQRMKEYDPNKNYNSNVFKQNLTKHPATPINFPRGSLSYIGARTHRGKTTALISIAWDAILQGQEVYFITTEETSDLIIIRMIKIVLYHFFNHNKPIFEALENVSDINELLKSYLKQYTPPAIQHGLKTEEKENVEKHYKRILFDSTPEGKDNYTLQQAVYFAYWIVNDLMNAGRFIIIDTLRQKTFEDLIEAIGLLNSGAVVLLDYIQHVKNPKDAGVNNRQVLIQNESHQLADAAGTNDLIIISGGQFSRKADEKKGNADKYKPDFLDMSLFRESGDIEQDADIIIGIGEQANINDPHAPARFYEILKYRHHQSDDTQYLIDDNAKYSLYHCKEEMSNGNKYVKQFHEMQSPVKESSGGTPAGEGKAPLFTM